MVVKSDTSFVPCGMTGWGDIHRSCGTSSGHIDLHSTQYSPQVKHVSVAITLTLEPRSFSACWCQNWTSFTPRQLLFGCFKSTRIRWTGHMAGVGDKRNAYSVLVGKPDGRPACRWEDDDTMGFQRGKGVDWIRVTRCWCMWRVANYVKNLQVV